jgi:hypothetical protein
VIKLPFKLLVLLTTIGLVVGGIWGTLNLDQVQFLIKSFNQCFSDPDSKFLDPDPHYECGSGSRREKISPKNRRKIKSEDQKKYEN